MTTGITVPVSLWVWALKALQNSMMLIPCWPRAGPTGGAGLACPAFAWSLIVVRTFLAIFFFRFLSGERVGGQARQGRSERSVLVHTSDRGCRLAPASARSELFDLVEAYLHGSLATKDRYQDLEPGRVLVDLGDLAGEVREGTGDDLDGLA